MTTAPDALPDDGRPLLLIDVDGVLNAVNRSQNRKVYNIFRAGGSDASRGFTIRFRHELGDWLTELAEHYHLVWCTTWDDLANTELAEHLDLPALPVIPCIERDIYPPTIHLAHFKQGVVERHAGDRPYAWIDDDFDTRRDLDWAYLRTEAGFPTKLLPIRASAGLQRHHVDKLIAWANSLQAVPGD